MNEANENTPGTSEGGPGPTGPTATIPAPASPPGLVPTVGAPPPTAHTALTGQKSENEIRLEQELEAARTDHESTRLILKARETTISELEDENQKLKAPTPVQIKKKAPKVVAFGCMRRP